VNDRSLTLQPIQTMQIQPPNLVAIPYLSTYQSPPNIRLKSD